MSKKGREGGKKSETEQLGNCHIFPHISLFWKPYLYLSFPFCMWIAVFVVPKCLEATSVADVSDLPSSPFIANALNSPNELFPHSNAFLRDPYPFFKPFLKASYPCLKAFLRHS